MNGRENIQGREWMLYRTITVKYLCAVLLYEYLLEYDKDDDNDNAGEDSDNILYMHAHSYMHCWSSILANITLTKTDCNMSSQIIR